MPRMVSAQCIRLIFPELPFFRVALPPGSAPTGADLDIFVFDPSGNLAGSSTKSGTDEQVNIRFPADGTWTVYIHGWAAPGGVSDYNLYNWSLSAAPDGGLKITGAPKKAVLSETATIRVDWVGAGNQWYLGAVSHTGPKGMIGLTLIDVDNR